MLNYIRNMNEKIRNLTWGVGLYALYTILYSYQIPLLKLCGALTPSQTLALMFVGEFLSQIPFMFLIYQKWSISKRREWIAFGTLGCMLAGYHGAAAYCAQKVNLGEKRLYHRICCGKTGISVIANA